MLKELRLKKEEMKRCPKDVQNNRSKTGEDFIKQKMQLIF